MTREEAVLNARDFLRTFAPPLKRNAAVSAGLLGAVANTAAAKTATAAAAASSVRWVTPGSGVGPTPGVTPSTAARPTAVLASSPPACAAPDPGVRPEARGGFRIVVMSLAGRSYIVEGLTSGTTVEGLKQAFQNAHGIPPDRQRLVLAHRQMEDCRTLGEYGIQEGSVIDLILRLAGC
jgi:ubiquitin-large subunit ribosomal protein L40e